MPKYHINEHGEPARCQATVRTCPVGGEETHFEGGFKQAVAWAEQKNAEDVGGAFGNKASSAPTANTNKQTSNNLTPSIKNGLPADPQEHNTPLYSHPKIFDLAYNDAVDYDYRTVTNCEDYGCDSEGICRCGRIVDAHAEITNTNDFVAEVLNVSPGEAPKPLVDYVESNKDLEVSTVGGYYGEEIESVTISEEVQQTVENFYYSQPNVKDLGGALSYARSEGVDTSRKRPLEALQTIIDQEDGIATKYKKQAREADTLSAGKVPFDKIKVSVNKYKQAKDDTYDFSGQQKKAAQQPEAGIVIKQDDGSYQLVSGYERFKAAQKQGAKTWRFQVISPDTKTKRSSKKNGA